MSILAIDTSNKTLVVGVVGKTGKVYERIFLETLQHSVQLMPTIEAVLLESGMSIKDITKIVVAKGPGSYTGLRIGVTVAKTLAKTLGIPLVAVSSLLPLVSNVMSNEEVNYICPFFDARRDNIFTGLYHISDNGTIEVAVAEVHISWDEWLSSLHSLQQPIEFVGLLSDRQRSLVEERLGDFAHFAQLEDAIPNTIGLVGLGEDFEEVVDPDTFVPTYLKLAEAEEKWQAAHPSQEECDYVERM